MAVAGTYDFYLVALSFAVACFASYTALDLGTRIRAAEGRTRAAWLITAAVAMGGGIWSMHFIAMLAFLMPMPMSYDVETTVLSLVVAVCVTGLGFYGMGQKRATMSQLLSAGIVMGLGIVSMHYTGMAAMRMPGHINYDSYLVGLSVLIAIGASTAALWLAFRTSALWQRSLAAIVMGIAISGMHYTGMAAASFTSHGGTVSGQQAAEFAQTNLALAIASITFLILILALIASTFDRQFARLAERETELLRDREELLRRIYRDTPLPLHVLAADGTIEKVSDAWLGLIGCTSEEAIGRQLTDFMTEESKSRYADIAFPKVLVGSDIREAEYQLTRKSGEIIDVVMSTRRDIVGGRPDRALGGLVDITARKRAEQALLQSQRMEAIGQLTGGVAHDFNNLLMVISGAGDQLRRRLSDDRSARLLEMIVAAVTRGKTLTGHLLSFARRQTLEASVVDLSQMLANIGEMLKRSLRGDIEISTSTPDVSCRTQVDPSGLELALLNLGVNARDAMPNGGMLAVSVRKAVLRGQPEFDGLRGEFVAIQVKDTGAGIPADVLPRVFDPFFTTKGPGQGTGLGLSQVYGFAKQSGGTVKVESTVGIGTTVTMYLPATEQAMESEGSVEPPSADIHSAKGTVLLVEDNEDVALATEGLLSELGYDVEHVNSGTDALEKLQTGSYAFVLSDILMPGSIGGLELAGIVRDHHRDVQLLLTTGFSTRAQQAVDEGYRILQKPFDLNALARAIEELKRERQAA